MAERRRWVSNIKISILLKKGDSLMSEYPCNEKNNTFTWLSSLYNLFKLYFLDQKRKDKIFNKE